jgi:hypothetical protein
MIFPARLAVARVAASGYQSMTNAGYGGGRFSVITVRDIENEDSFRKLSITCRASNQLHIRPGNNPDRPRL